MSIKQRILLTILMAALFICGCSCLPHKASIQPSPRMVLPEEIHFYPKGNPFKHARVAVCWFGEPAYTHGAGKLAARALIDGLLKRRVFAYVNMELSSDRESITQANGPAGACRYYNDYDLMIMGDVTHYMDGSDYLAASVTERISVVHVSTGQILWSATAVSRSDPVPYRDYIFYQRSGVPADPTRALIDRNAAKFCNMLLNLPAQTADNGSAYSPRLRVSRVAFENAQEQVKHLQKQNEMLEQKLLKTVETGKNLQEKVDTLTDQTDRLEAKLKEEIDKGEITLKRDKTK